MKIIEGMKKVKENKEKIKDLQNKIASNCANLSHETPLYGADTDSKISEWLQSCTDISQENVRLLVAISRTNMATQVTIELGGKNVTKSIAEWVWRRREYAAIDAMVWKQLGDRNLREGNISTSVGTTIQVTIQRHFNPTVRDEKLAEYQSEPHRIDAALEVINAVTELITA